MKDKIAIIGGPTLGNPTEIYEALHGKNQVILIEGESKEATMIIENTYISEAYFIPPLTRKERRKLERKNKKHEKDNNKETE